MPSYRFPILIWEHFGGGYTACLVEDDNDVAAVAPTRSAAVAQIKDLLRWRYRQMPWLAKPDFFRGGTDMDQSGRSPGIHGEGSADALPGNGHVSRGVRAGRMIRGCCNARCRPWESGSTTTKKRLCPDLWGIMCRPR